MRRRSLAAPMLLVAIGGLFLWRNIHPELPLFDLIATYWPFALIAWGLVRLIEVAIWSPSRHPSLTGGEIVLVNHLGAERGLRAIGEKCFAPLARRLGWRPEFGWQRLARWAARHGGVELIERRTMPPLGHFSLIRFARKASA